MLRYVLVLFFLVGSVRAGSIYLHVLNDTLYDLGQYGTSSSSNIVYATLNGGTGSDCGYGTAPGGTTTKVLGWGAGRVDVWYLCKYTAGVPPVWIGGWQRLNTGDEHQFVTASEGLRAACFVGYTNVYRAHLCLTNLTLGSIYVQALSNSVPFEVNRVPPGGVYCMDRQWSGSYDDQLWEARIVTPANPEFTEWTTASPNVPAIYATNSVATTGGNYNYQPPIGGSGTNIITGGSGVSGGGLDTSSQAVVDAINRLASQIGTNLAGGGSTSVTVSNNVTVTNQVTLSVTN
ncbi:MAG: hypothetical protein H7835_18595, partial [Magnetococcus sp. XQGC-1]